MHNLSVSIYCRFCITMQRYIVRYLIVIPWARVVCLIYTPAAGPRAEGVYIRRTTSAHGITNM